MGDTNFGRSTMNALAAPYHQRIPNVDRIVWEEGCRYQKEGEILLYLQYCISCCQTMTYYVYQHTITYPELI